MTGDQAIKVLKEKTELDVHPDPVRSAIKSQPGDVEAAVKQVIDWWATGESRSKKAGTLLLAALRSQQARPRTASVQPKAYWQGLEAEARALLPDESPGLVAGAIQVVRYAGRPVTAENVLARMRACSFEARP